ncbi:hypothetical protein GCK72_016438 [Caenorhabditis remanei]|uniref:Uncharacterized protein n=1 Tax=Caenorhabditis remanei TaxID=31234 RepID=A0A6A5G515_CAERE|nr:hypothetical protein GCK72_016438 [Caenorhabditis remanei]KAF1749893.1 hypothetical protein GCK72_016438 [Caenorhabditis remanei]
MRRFLIFKDEDDLNVDVSESEILNPDLQRRRSKSFSKNRIILEKTAKASFTQNLSAVLADPSRSRNDLSTFFTRHWGDTFVPSQPVPPSKRLARMADSSFDSYCQAAGESYRRYQAIKRALRLSHAEGSNVGNERQDAEDLPTVLIDKLTDILLAQVDTSGVDSGSEGWRSVDHKEELELLKYQNR